MGWNLAWRLFRHEARRGELTIILAAIVLSVSAVMSLSLFSERLQQALTDRTAQYLAADRIAEGRKPLPVEWQQKAAEMGLKTAHGYSTRSMAFAGDNMLLVRVRSVSDQYPLKGDVKITDNPFGVGQITENLPAPGEVWVDSKIIQQLSVVVGDTLEIGEKALTITQILAEIPDQGFSVFDASPVILMRQEDIAQTNIQGPGSRGAHTLWLAGDASVLDAFYEWLEPQMDDELHWWMSVEDEESPIGRSVGRAEQYFLLASLLAIVLASVAIAVAAQRYSQRHYDPVAIMKTLGASRKTVQKVYLLQISFITLLGIILGTLVGYLIQQGVVMLVQDQVSVSLQSWYWGPVAIAVFTGVTCAMLFSLYPLVKLFSVPPLRVLRKDLGASVSSRAIQFLAAGGAIFLLMWVYSNNLKISAILFASGVVLVIALMLVTYVLIWIGRHLGQGRMGAWQLAWARIQRRAMDNSVQLISFSVTIMLLLVVLVMRNDMVKQWRDQLPEGTPNYFMANITEAQLPQIERHFGTYDTRIEEFYPVIRGRFVAVNGEKFNTEVTKEEDNTENANQRRGLGREANLTWSNQLQYENKIVQGQWHGDKAVTDTFEVSVEEEAAKRMDIKLGDVLTFNIGSEVVDTTVTSIRSVNWQTMQPNFFFVLQPEVMQTFSPTYITSFHLEGDKRQNIAPMMAPFPTVTLFDVDQRINQLRDIVGQVSMAVEFILVLVLVAGALVLIAQVQASMDERQQELAILRTLGAKGSLIRSSVIFEFIIIGVVAGLMAAMSNELTLYLLQTQVFNMSSTIHWAYWGIAPAVGALVVGLLGAISCWRLLTLNTSHLLRKMV